MKKTIFLILIITLLLNGCGSSTETITSEDPAAQFDPESQELGLSTKLALGTLKLEDTDHAVAPDQAADLLPLWQVLNNLSSSDSASQTEIEALIDQIQEMMTPEQLAVIEEMGLTRADIFTTMQELGLVNEPQVNAEVTPQTGREFGGGSPEGGFPGGGPPGGGPGGEFGSQNLSPEQIGTMQARRAENGGRMNTRLLTPLVEAVIELLESKVQ